MVWNLPIYLWLRRNPDYYISRISAPLCSPRPQTIRTIPKSKYSVSLVQGAFGGKIRELKFAKYLPGVKYLALPLP
jgi:hypothetical protein